MTIWGGFSFFREIQDFDFLYSLPILGCDYFIESVTSDFSITCETYKLSSSSVGSTAVCFLRVGRPPLKVSLPFHTEKDLWGSKGGL